jgi:hypothetical protein
MRCLFLSQGILRSAPAWTAICVTTLQMYSEVRNRKRTRFVWGLNVATWTSRHLNGSFSDKNKATCFQCVCIHFPAGSPRSRRCSGRRSHKAQEKRIERGFTSDCGSEENREFRTLTATDLVGRLRGVVRAIYSCRDTEGMG